MATVKIYDENDDINEDDIYDSDYVQEQPLQDTQDEEDEKEQAETFSSANYKVSSISDSFLKLEEGIKIESSKTTIKFKYRGEILRGVVMKKMPNSKDDYIFLVQKAGKLEKGDKNPKVLKKIHIPDASLM